MKKTCNHCVACEFIECSELKNSKFFCHQANANLENLWGAEDCQCYQPIEEKGTRLERKYELALKELKKVYEENEQLKDKLNTAREWLLDIANSNENASDFQRYMQHEWDWKQC